MKRIKDKISKRSKKAQDTAPERITNETVAEHREKILAGGRRFKYPHQYARTRLIRNTILVVVAAIVALAGLIWWQLYPSQTTNTFFYRVTQILPLPVASVDKEPVPYSYYLMNLRANMNAIKRINNVDFSTKDGERQLNYLKRQTLNDAISYAYATKLAKENNITVSDKEVDDYIETVRKRDYKGAINQSAFETAIRQFYDWSYDEFRDSTKGKLLRNKVLRETDSAARQKADSVLKQLQGGADFATVAKNTSSDVNVSQTGGDQGLVDRESQDPNNLVAEAAKLKQNEISGVITGNDGYYIVKLLEANDTQVRFARIFIAYKEFDDKIATLRKNNGIQEYINVANDIGPIQQSRNSND